MKKGFTLIELLAVIVILGIIALIAVPIVANIIDDAEKEAELRSAENYVEAVNLAILNYNMSNKFKEGTCTVQSTGNLLCGDKTIVVDVEKTKATSGTLVIENRRVKTVTNLAIGENTYSTDTNGKLVLNASNDESNNEVEYVQVFKPQYYGWDVYGRIGFDDSNLTSNLSAYQNPPSGKEFYLGFDVESNKITAAYICFMKNGNEYCIKGYDSSSYSENIEVVNSLFGEDYCGIDEDPTYACDCDICTGEGTVRVDPSYINVEEYPELDYNHYIGCQVDNNGNFECVDSNEIETT